MKQITILLLLMMACGMKATATSSEACTPSASSIGMMPEEDNDDADKTSMRIKSAFGVLDKENDYSKDYTVAWARIDCTNADTTKVGYLWDTHSFNIDPFLKAIADKGDATTELFYRNADAADNGANELAGKNAAATDSLKVENIRIYSGDGIEAVNSHDAEGTAKTIFDIQLVANYYGIIPSVLDRFKYSVVSPINYGIYRGGKKDVEATVDNVGDVAVDMKDFEWNDFSNNKNTFNLSDERISNVKCELVKDDGNNYGLVKDKEVVYDKNDNRLKFSINHGAVTRDCILNINIVVVDYWGIKTSLPITVNVRSNEGEVTNVTLAEKVGNAKTTVYGSNGVKRNSLQTGINIVVTPEGKAIKVAGK